MTTALLAGMLTAGATVALAPSAAAADIQPRDLTITVTDLGPEHRTCRIDADLYVPAGVTAQSPGPALAGEDMAYRGSTAPQPVALTTGGTAQKLTLPVVG